MKTSTSRREFSVRFTNADIEAILKAEALKLCPSGFEDKPCRFLIVRNDSSWGGGYEAVVGFKETL